MGNQQEKQGKKFQNSLSVIKKMSIKSTKRFEELFQKCNTNDIQQVSGVLNLSQKIKEYVNTDIIQTLNEFQKQYSMYREVRGDGNCFYRSVFFLYLEHLVIMNQSNPKEVEKRLDQLIQISAELDKFIMTSSIPLELEKFLYHVSKFFQCGIYLIQVDIINNSQIQKIHQKIELLQKFINTYPIFDFSTILLMRKVALLGHQKFQQEMQHFYLGNEVQTIQDYSIEGQNCIMKLISEFLQIPIQIENVQSKFVNTVKFTPEFSIKDENYVEFPTLFLFFRPGHYDICYPTEYVNQVYLISKTKKAEKISNNQQIIQSKNHQVNEKFSYDFTLKESCFFCKCNIFMLINEMRICQECYNQKIGQNIQSNSCKICQAPNKEETTRPYCLCQKCEEQYLDFSNYTFIINKDHFKQKLPINVDQNIQQQIKENLPQKIQQQHDQNLNMNSLTPEKKNKPNLNSKQQSQSDVNNQQNKQISESKNTSNTPKEKNQIQQQQSYIIQNNEDKYESPQIIKQNIYNDVVQNLSDNQFNHEQKNIRKNTLIQENAFLLNSYIVQEETYINQANSEYVRCILCLNQIKEFKINNCKRHIICSKCSEDQKDLDQLCLCNKQNRHSEIQQQNLQQKQSYQIQV